MAQIEVADRITAASELTEGQVFTNNLYQESDVDYYKLPGTLFDVPSSVQVNFDLNGEKANSSAFKISFISYDGTTETVLKTTSTAIGTSIQASAAVAGKSYYIKVEKDSVYKNFDYKLSVDIAPTAESELVSSSDTNDTTMDGSPILGSATYYGRLSSADLAANEGDWYYFTTGSATGGTVSLNLSAFTKADATGALYNVKITDENGQTVTKSGNKSLSTSAGSTDGTLEFNVGETGTPAGTYFVQVTAVDTSTFSSSTENGKNYSLTLSGTSVFNTTPSITVADITSGATGTQKSSASDEFLGFKTESATKLSEFISAEDAESATDSTQNGSISSYMFRLVGASTAGKITYTKDSDGSAGEITAAASAQGAFTALSPTEFTTAQYVASSAEEEQSIYVLVKDGSGVSGVTNASNDSLTTKSDLSGVISYNLKSTSAGITITRVADQSTSELTEGSNDTITLTATLSGTLNTDETVRLIVSTKEDIVLSGGDVTSSSNANEYVISFTAAGDKTFTITAPSVADSDGTSESVAIDYSVVSTDSSSLFSGLKIESDSVTVSENVATISVGAVTYSSGSSIEEGKSATATYVVSATGIADGQTLKLVVDGSKFDFISDQEFSLTSTNNTATIKVKAKENTDVDGNSSTGLFNASLTHSIYENNQLLTTYDVSDASISIKDNDVNFAPIAVNDVLTTPIDGVKSVVISGSELTANDTDANTGDTLTITSAVKTSTDVSGTLTVSDGNVIFTPDDSSYTGTANVGFNYSVSDGLLTDSGTATAVLNFIDGTPVTIDETGKYASTADVEIITGRASQADEFIFAKPTTGNLGTDTIKGFEAENDTLTLTGYSLSDYTVKTDTLGNTLVTLVDEGTITLEAASAGSTLSYKQLSSAASVELYLSGEKVDTISVSSSGIATGKNVTAFDSAKVSSVSDFATDIAKSGASTATNPINLSDVLAQLKHIINLKELKGAAFAAGDADNNNSINLSDVLANLKHIIGLKKIDTFDIVTEHGLVTDSLSSSSNGELSLVINGDADQSHADWDIIT